MRFQQNHGWCIPKTKRRSRCGQQGVSDLRQRPQGRGYLGSALGIAVAVLLVFGSVAGLHGQAPANPSQKTPPPSQANPFPGDTNNVPVLPNGNPAPSAAAPAATASPANLPGADVDPVASPDDPIQDSDGDAEGFSSSSTGLDRVPPPPDTDATGRRRKAKGAPAPEHQETAAEDEKVGDYYLSEKNWRAALSRYESAVVLDPENPEVYWGLGEAHRHLGQLADAKANYEKLVEYDPDSKHGKEAKKILKSPELNNAPTASAKQP